MCDLTNRGRSWKSIFASGFVDISAEGKRHIDNWIRYQSMRSLGPPIPEVLEGEHSLPERSNIFRHWLRLQGRLNEVAVAAMTARAARLVQGTTLYSLLGFPVNKDKLSSRVNYRLVKRFESMQMLVIDEVSLVGCRMLGQISAHLKKLKKSTQDFGGIHMVFGGDFFQLPPVGDQALYKAPKPPLDLPEPLTRSSAQGPRPQSLGNRETEKIQGYSLWRGLTDAVLLDQSMRAKYDRHFDNFLVDRRNGNARPWLPMLKERSLVRLRQNGLTIDRWKHSVVVATANTSREKIAKLKTAVLAQQGNLFTITAKDCCSDFTLADSLVTQYIKRLPSNKTGYLSGNLELYLGMPVTLTNNIAISCNLVNGASGVFRGLARDAAADVDDAVAIIEVPDYCGPPYPGLPAKFVPIAAITKEFTVQLHPRLPKWKIQRKQLPLEPAFACTDYKSQGMTFDNAILYVTPTDCRKNHSAQSIYVMLSRYRTFDDIAFLGDVPSAILDVKWQADLKQHDDWLRAIERRSRIDIQ